MKVSAIILAAGFGTRLAPLTDHTPKPLLDVGGRPVVSHLVNRLADVADLHQLIVVVNGRHVPQWHRWSESIDSEVRPQIISNGVVANQDRSGAVADLRLGANHLSNPDWVIVLAGDNLIEESLQPHLDAAAAAQCPVVLCRDLGTDVPPGRFGEITTDATGRIIKFREKPADPASPLAATCTYVLPGDVAVALDRYLVAGDADSPGSFVDWLAQQRPVHARTLTGRYFDIGNHQTLAAARVAHEVDPPARGR